MMRRLLRLVGAIFTAIGIIATAAGVWFASGGVGARTAPGPAETAAARRLRSLAIPRAARALANPVAATPEVVRSGMEHFADHCAVCHANDGSGDTETGRGLYPRPPDMRQQATQALSDGELFYIIENGVRLTGMPAWGSGTAESERASWNLVRFIRHLPVLTAEEQAEMSRLNPKSPGDHEQPDPEAFLKGEDSPVKPKSGHAHRGK